MLWRDQNSDLTPHLLTSAPIAGFFDPRRDAVVAPGHSTHINLRKENPNR